MLGRIFLHLRSVFFFRNLCILLVVAAVAGFVIVTHGREEKWYQYFAIPGIFSSALYSGIIAFILLLVVYVVSFIANVKYAGRDRNGQWLVFQLVYGVLLTIVVELVLATLLFWVMGFWIFDTAFFDKIFLVVVMFILLANLCYMLFYMQRVRYEVTVETVRYQPIPLSPLEMDSDEPRVEPTDQPALFYIRNGEAWRKSFQGKRSIWLKSLDSTMSQLDPQLYFKCARNWIVHRNAIASIRMISSRRIEVKCSFKVAINLIVSRRNAQKFKEWLYEL